MRVFVAAAIGLLLFSLIQAPVQAETQDYILYGIRTDGGYWITPNADDPNEGGLWGSSIQGVAPAPYAPEASDGREWILNMYHPEAPSLILDPAGTVVVAFTIGGGTAEAGTFDAGWQLRQDGTMVLAGPVKSVTYTQDTTSLLWEVPAGIDGLDPASLSLRVFTESSVGLGQRLSFTDQPTVSLPVVGVVGGEPAVHFEDVEGRVAHAFANATSDRYILNFTTDLVNSTLQFTWNGTAGGVNATVADADGTAVFEGAFTGDGTLSHDILQAVPGQWNITILYDGFTGTFAFELLAAQEPDVPEPVDPGTDNATVEADEPAPVPVDDKDAPLPLLAPLAGLLAAMGLRRRP